jgi:hypothetical protein
MGKIRSHSTIAVCMIAAICLVACSPRSRRSPDSNGGSDGVWEDCSGWEFRDQDCLDSGAGCWEFLGDGTCDSGGWPAPDFSCAAWSWDNGDCSSGFGDDDDDDDDWPYNPPSGDDDDDDDDNPYNPPPSNSEPDLVSSGFSVQVAALEMGTSSASVFACANRTVGGDDEYRGHHLTVRNAGDAATGPFRVAMGLKNVVTGAAWWANSGLDSGSLQPGQSASWSEEWCLGASTASMPSGTYTVQFLIDADHDVNESSETNNIMAGGEELLVY